MHQKLYIVRGLPGSGKSTYANNLKNSDPMIVGFEADQFFIDFNGVYKFDADYLSSAHDWCHTNTLKYLYSGYDVVVSNTFVKMWEMERYFILSRIFPQLSIKVIELKTNYGTIHGVPEKTIQLMRENWEEVPDDIISGKIVIS